MKLFHIVLLFALVFGLNQITAKSISSESIPSESIPSESIPSESIPNNSEENDLDGDLNQLFEENSPLNIKNDESLHEITNDPAIPMLFTMGLFTLMSMLSKESSFNANIKLIDELMSNHLARSKRSTDTKRWSNSLFENIFDRVVSAIEKYQTMEHEILTESQILNMN